MTVMDAIAGLRDKLNFRLRERRTVAIENYQDLVVAYANGDDVDEDEAANVMEAAGKTLADLEADVALYRRRMKWSEELQAEPAATAEVRRIEAEKNNKRQVFAAAEKKFQAEMRELSLQQSAAVSKSDAGMIARAELLRTFSNPVVAEREAELAKLRSNAAERLRHVEGELSPTQSGSEAMRHQQATTALARYESQDKQSEAYHDNPTFREQTDAHITRLTAAVAGLDESLRKLNGEREQLRAQLAEIERETQEIVARKLRP